LYFHSEKIIDYNESMFQLTDASLERIIFAMENQSSKLQINLENGDIVDEKQITENSEALRKGSFASPPPWDSRRGFALLEAFAATVTSPPEIKAALNAALRRGKGVFKAFRKALAADDALLHRFQEFKLRSMRPFVEEWLQAMQEGQSLAVLKDAPEDIADLIDSEIDFRIEPLEKVLFNLENFIQESSQEGLPFLPSQVRAWYLDALFSEIRNSTGSHYVALAMVERESPLFVGLFSLEVSIPLRGLCIVHMVLGKKESLVLNLEWQLLDKMCEYARSLGATCIMLNGPFYPSSVTDEASEHGYTRSGAIMYKNL